MRFLSSSRSRGGMLLVCLALVGGTGCITTAVVQNVQRHNNALEKERERQQRIAALSPRAQAGDPRAMTALAQALVSAEERPNNDMPRALTLLSSAAEQGDGLAQAMLGDLLTAGSVQFSRYLVSDWQRDRVRGIALLKKAALQACRFTPPGRTDEYRPVIVPADRLANLYGFDHQVEQARLWRARSIVHCGVPDPTSLTFAINLAKTEEERQERFALVLLTKSGPAIETARSRTRLTPDDILPAERKAEALRRLVAESEKLEPPPARKELP